MASHSDLSSEQQVIQSVWRDQALWSELASQFKRDLNVWRLRAAVASVAGAFLATLAVSLGESANVEVGSSQAVIALLGAIVLAIVPYVNRVKASHEQMQRWIRARSTSEALKLTIYKFLLRTTPFDPTSSPESLIQHCNDIKAEVQDIHLHAAAIDPPLKDRPLALDVDAYVAQRVDDQLHYYFREARRRAHTAKRHHDAEFLLGLLAVVMGVAASAAATTGITWLPLLGTWVAVVTTAGSALTAHIAALRYDYEATSYFATANRLRGLRDAWLGRSDRRDRDVVGAFVDECEQAISTQNQSWLAEWNREETRK